YSTMWHHIRTQGSWQGEIWNKRKNGNIYPQHILIAAVRDESAQVTNYIATITDISAHKASEERARFLALYDPLTQLPNRSLFLEQLEKSMQDAKNTRKIGAILCIDLDYFKIINDIEGHEMGDLLLQQVATRLLNCVTDNHLVARLGNDEFVILLNQLGDSETEVTPQVEKITQNILHAIAQPYFLADSEYHSSATIGISLFGLEENEITQDPIKRADMALAEA